MIEFDKQLVIAASNDVKTVYGRLTADAEFKVKVDGGAPVTVTVDKDATATNNTAADLANDVNAFLAVAGLAAQVQAVADGNRLALIRLGNAGSLEINALNGTPAVTQMGFRDGQKAVSNNGQLRLTAAADVSAFVGRLSGPAVLNVSMNSVNGGAPIAVTIPKVDTDPNRNILDVVVDVQNALDKAGNGILKEKIKVGSIGRRLLLTVTDNAPGTTSFSVTAAANDPAVTELGFAVNNTGSGADIVITTRNGTKYGVSFDNLPASPTLGDVINAIETQTSGKVDVQFTDGNTRLRLVDTTSSGNVVFKVENAIGSVAANLLGILGADVVDANDPAEKIDHRFDSAPLGGVDPLDRLFIQDADVQAGFEIDTPGAGVTVAAQFGFVGIALNGDGHLEGTVSMGLKDPDTSSPDGRITLRELFDSLSDIDTLLDAPQVDGNGSLVFDVAMDPPIPGLITPGNSPTVTVTINDIGDPFAMQLPDIVVTTANFGDLANFDDIGFESILAAFQALVDFLSGFEEFEFLQEPIPLINVSVNDMLSYADEFGHALDEIKQNPAATIQLLEQKLKQALNIPQASDLLKLKLVKDGAARILRFDVHFKPTFSDSMSIGFDLPSGFELSGGADLKTQGNVDLKLNFGVDLNDPTKVWMFQDTGIDGHLDAAANDVAFTIGLGDPDGGAFVGGRIVDGNLSLAGDFGFTILNGVLIGTGLDHRILLPDLLGNLSGSVDPSMAITVDGNLPVYFPTESMYRGDILIGGSLATSIANGIDVTGTVGSGPNNTGTDLIYVPDLILNFDFSQFSALDNLLLIVDGVDGFLGFVQDFLDGELAGMKMPLIGDKLSNAADFLGDFREEFIAGLRDMVETSNDPTANYLSQQLFALLHGDLNPDLNILADRNNDGNVTIADIQLQTNIDDPGVAPKDLFMQWNLKLGGTLLDAGTGIDFDLGIPGLGLETRGAVHVDIGWDVDLGFGIGGGKGFYLDLSDPDELRLDADVTLPGAGLTGRLAFLQLDADDNGNTHLGATVAVDLFEKNHNDARVGMADFGNIQIQAGLAAEAIADLGFELQLNSELVPTADTAFPKVVADLYFEWSSAHLASASVRRLRRRERHAERRQRRP